MAALNIIKVGGGIVEDGVALRKLLSSFEQLPGLKVLVHGGGRMATNMASRLGVETRMVEGRRITDESMLQIVTMVYGGLVNKNVVAGLQALGVNSIGLTGADANCILSEKRPVTDVDYGYAGDVRKVDAAMLDSLIKAGLVPVVAPLTHDGKGHILNTNADTVASEVAKALSSYYDVTLTFCFEKKGVLMSEEDGDSVIPEIRMNDFKKYMAIGTIRGGMIPKLHNAFHALEAGVSKVVITNASDLAGNGGTVVLL
ncbi:MAG: acetylglutamate kinase [Bacteroidales bacterium]